MADAEFFGDADYPVVPKGWGREVWITNNSLYCGKIITLFAGKKLSWHFHRIKDEVIYVQEGAVIFRHSAEDDLSGASEVVLREGQSVRIPPNTRHQIEATQDTRLLEFSTEHFESDSVRVVKGD